jgi:phosphatidylglycerophosphatase A
MADPAGRPRFDPRRPHHWLAFGLGAGLLPKAPGTWGTLVAVPFYPLLAGLSLPAYLLLLAGMFGLGVWACGRTGRELGVHDHGAIVWDEVVGFLVSVAGLPPTWPWLLAGFVLFRLFDILKPWPIGWLDRRVSGGLGVMLDDLVAGLMTLAVLQLGRFGLGV